MRISVCLSQRTKKRVLVAVLCVLLSLDVYLLYASAGALYGWSIQPMFINEAGEATRSYGFLVVAGVCFALFILALAGTLLYVHFAFFKKRKAIQKAAPNCDVTPKDWTKVE
jgi:hypothetical protein